MSLEKLKEELREEIAALDKPEEEVENEEEAADEPEPAPEPEPALEEPAKEPETDDEKPDAAAFQRLRRENAAFKKQLEKPAEEIEAPTQDDDIAEVLREHKMTKAERYFYSLEAEFKRTTPEYGAVAQEYTMALAQSIKLQNPRISQDELVRKTKETVLLKAAGYVKDGLNPVEELYNDAKELGFKGKKNDEKPKEEKIEKPDMDRVAKNRNKSAGTAASTGKQPVNLSRASIRQNGLPSPAEWKKLSADQKKNLLYADD